MTNGPQTIYRPARRAQFTVISNAIMNDGHLSAEALGVLVYLLSRPDDWIIHREQLMARFKVGRDKFQAIFRELSGCGYARLESIADAESGHLAGKRWVIIEEPEAESREPEKPSLGGVTEERVCRLSEKPTVGKPGHIINTDLKPNTDSELKTVPPLPPAAAVSDGGEGLWSRFERAWPWQDGQSESVEAARRAFGRLSEADKRLCVEGAQAFQPRPGRVCAAVFVTERHWTAVPRRSRPDTSTSASCASSAKASKRSDGTWWLAPDSPQLQRWHEHERKAFGKAKMGCVRPSEWPPGTVSAPRAAENEQHAAC
jgi:hypothetical protein